jgi:hypothetical protein
MKNSLSLVILLFFACCAFAQPVLIDEAVQADGLTCFPVYGDSLRYKYLPSRGHVALSADNLPEFSMLRYVTQRKTAATSSAATTISEADGGAILHFLVLYDTPIEQVRRAESKLRSKLKKNLVLEGPVLFTRGSYMLISSILQDGKEKKTMIHSGEAPVFENSKVSFSFSLDELQSQLMMESFKMATPDISIMFDLSFSGLTFAYQGQLEVNWSEVQKSTYTRESMDFIFYSHDLEKSFGELIKTGAVKMTTVGKDSSAEAMMNMVYEKLLNQMFDPVRPEMLPRDKKGGVLEDIFGIRGPSSLLLIGGSSGYRKKEIKTSGKTVVSFNSRFTATRHHFVTFNIGDMWKKYGENKRFFRDVALDDPLYQQRDVHVSVDGDITDEFEKMVNNVSITLKKDHSNGEQTVRELLLDKKLLSTTRGPLIMSYLNKGDSDRQEWIKYQYQVVWNFKTDGQYVQPWASASSPMINLFTPYKYHEIILEGDWGKMQEEGYRAVNILIEYDFFGKMKTARETIRATDAGKEKKFTLILPANKDEVDYTITWIGEGKKKELRNKDKFGVIFWDEIPK